jgi:hypothetical protein
MPQNVAGAGTGASTSYTYKYRYRYRYMYGYRYGWKMRTGLGLEGDLVLLFGVSGSLFGSKFTCGNEWRTRSDRG